MKRLLALFMAANLVGCASFNSTGVAPLNANATQAGSAGTVIAGTGLIALAAAAGDIALLPLALPLALAGLAQAGRRAETGVAGGVNDEGYQGRMRAASVRASWPQNQYPVLR